MLSLQDFYYRGVKNIYITLYILKKGDRIAYYALAIKILTVLAFPLNWTVYFMEKFLRKTPAAQSPLPIIFVVGPQRSGTTLISQVIADAFPFFPVGNICAVFSRSSYYVHKLLKRFLSRGKIHFYNFYGIAPGVFTIGDCYEVWDQWFGKNHYTVPETISSRREKRIKNYFSNLYGIYQRPVISKNNRHALCMTRLQELFPEAFFIVTCRDETEVILSTFQAGKIFFGNNKYLWGLKTKNFDEKAYPDPLEAAAFQYAYLDKHIKTQLSQVGKENYHVIQYESFCEAPDQELQSLYLKLKKRMDIPKSQIKFDYTSFPILRPSNQNKELAERIRHYYQKAIKNIMPDE